DGRDAVAGGVVYRDVRAPLARLLELCIRGRRDDRARAERTRNLEGCGRDTAADPPDQHPLALAQPSARDEHPVSRLEHQREGGCNLEGEAPVEREDLL